MMSRRSALRSAAALAAAGSLARAESPAATRKGRVNHAVCRWCYNKIPLEELCRAAKSMGIAGIDLLSLDQVPVARAHGLACSLLSGVPGGIGKGLNRPEHHDAIVAWFEEAAPAAAALGVTNLIVFSGNRDGLDDAAGLENCAAGIKRLLPICGKHGVVAIMELLNSKVNHPDYQCDHTRWGVDLCKLVGSPRFKLLYDIYHMQIMEGDVIRTIQESHEFIGHYHTGGVPGRNEIDESQELFYPAIIRAIVATGFTGFIAQEFIPKGPDPLAALRQAIEICDV
jgi:hydroxypyruvate isomerase